MCKYCEVNNGQEKKRILEDRDATESAYALIECTRGWFITSCREEGFETYQIKYCPMCDRELKITKKILKDIGVQYSDKDGFDYSGCPSDFGLKNTENVCGPSGDGCPDCIRNAFEEIWFAKEEKPTEKGADR